MRLREDDIGLLLPCYQPYVRELRRLLILDGYDPCVRDTLRTPEEAANFARLGTGSKNSVHCDGAASDFVCQAHHWDCADHGCKFYVAYGRHCAALSLFWGGLWRNRDMPHNQAIPADILVQRKLRLLKSPEEKNAFVIKFLKPLKVAA